MAFAENMSCSEISNGSFSCCVHLSFCYNSVGGVCHAQVVWFWGMGMIFVTSDLHFGHKNIIAYTNRPFPSAKEMDAALIDNWNRVVRENDEVYILGDFTMQNEKVADSLFLRLRGRKYLIRGNHDYFAEKYHGAMLEWIKDYYELRFNKNLFVLSHYPFAEWNRSHHGAYHLHGHQHNHSDYNLRQRKDGTRRYDVGVDANGYSPVPLEKIVSFFVN